MSRKSANRDFVFAYPADITIQEGGFLVRFPDLPEAITEGDDEDEALRQAADCLAEAIASRIVDHEDIPKPTPARRGQYLVAVEQVLATKAALHLTMRQTDTTNVALANVLEVDEKEVRRLLDPRHNSKVNRLQAALAICGRHTTVTLRDAVGVERAPLRSQSSKLRGGRPIPGVSLVE